MEAAPWGRVDRARHIPRQNGARPSCSGVGDRHGRQQRFGVWVLWRLEQRRPRGDLDDLAEIHDGNAVADVLDHAKIMRDEKVAQPEFLLQVHHQVDDLCLHRDIERRDRLIPDDHAGAERQGPRDAEPLPLPTGEFMRIIGALVRTQPHTGK